MSNPTQTARSNAKPELSIVQIATQSQAMALVPSSLDGAMMLARWLSACSFLPDNLRGKEGDIFAIMMAGAELGLPPMATLRGLYIVNGKPALEAKTKMAICLERGAAKYFKKVEDTPLAVTWETMRQGDTEPRRSRFTMVEAKAAGLTDKKGPWTQYPQRMLSWRAAGFLCDDNYPDIVLGVATAEDFQPEQFDFKPIGAGVELGTPKAQLAAVPPPAKVDAPAPAATPTPTTAPAAESEQLDVLTAEECDAIIERIGEMVSVDDLQELARTEINNSKKGITSDQRDRMAKAYSARRTALREGGAA